jgi:gag-polypeptide of LTR copia-type
MSTPTQPQVPELTPQLLSLLLQQLAGGATGTSTTSNAPNLYDDVHFRPAMYKPEILSDTNYGIWKLKALQTLKEYSLLGIVDGTEARPVYADLLAPTIDESTAERIWDRMDARAQNLILERIRDTHTHVVENAKSAKEMWDRLEQHYQKDATLSPAYAIRALFLHTWNENESTLEEVMAYVESKVNDLKKFEGTVPDLIDLIHALALVHCLPPSWSQTINVLMSKDQMDLKNVIQTLKRTNHHNQVETGESAMLARVKGLSKARLGQTSAMKPKCDNCAKRGHTRDRCWAKGGGQEGKGPKSNPFGGKQNRSGKGKGKEHSAQVAAKQNAEDGELSDSANEYEADILHMETTLYQPI